VKYFDGKTGAVYDSDEDAGAVDPLLSEPHRLAELSEAGLAVVRGSGKAKDRVPGHRRPKGAENREAAAQAAAKPKKETTRSRKSGGKKSSS
jgi:hypothetical protein